MMAAPALYAQDAPANAVSIDPLLIIFNMYKGTYELRVADQFSAMAEVAYTPNFFWGIHQYTKLTYLDLIGKGRYYVGSLLKGAADDIGNEKIRGYVGRAFTDALGGVFVGGFLGCVNSVVEQGTGANYFRADFNGFGGGLELGLKYIFGDSGLSFFAEPYVLLRYYVGGYAYRDESGATIVKPEDFADGFDRNGIAAGVNIGVSF